MALEHSSSLALTVKLRFTWAASLRRTPPAPSQVIRRSSVFQPRCSVWKLTSMTWVSMRIGGMAESSNCASQYASTSRSKKVPAPPVDQELEVWDVVTKVLCAPTRSFGVLVPIALDVGNYPQRLRAFSHYITKYNSQIVLLI